MSNPIRSIRRAREQKQPETVTLKLNQVIGSQGALGALLGQPLPARQAFEIGKMVRAINGELEAYETARKALCERFSDGKMKNDGKEYDIPDETLPAFQKEMSDLLDAEVHLSIKPLNLDSLNGITISPGHMMQLDWLILDQ